MQVLPNVFLFKVSSEYLFKKFLDLTKAGEHFKAKNVSLLQKEKSNSIL